ncbi:MAG TPA: 1-deoxy-D-xylulose-5-phosphate reductoisomerase [Casimicrobiaceae bacterium]|nr:1-deoxy-D-xylulose-5-phosphate reductoisomerase [Casimicrobiaceae bacterium]
MIAPTPARNIAILGATGSIGASALDVIARHPERFAVMALTANRQWEALFDLACRFQPRYAAMLDIGAASELEAAIRSAGMATRVLAGPAGLCAIAALPEVDTVIAAIVGATGLDPTLAAAKSGKRILLANKETLVLAGKLFIAALRDGGATLLPIDSEHNAIFQCLPPDRACGEAARGVRRILLTASGGPFRSTPHNELSAVTPEQACAHPTWRMGRKISVDSATMMNKGLEVIEARWLFGVPAEAIDVVIHPQSIVHSMVEYVDGSVLAQLGNPDMRTPIAQALAWPDRIAAGVAPLDLAGLGALDFAAPDPARFPCLGLAYDALRADGTAPAMLNAANEVAVAAFLEHRIRFTQIAAACEETMSRLASRPLTTLDEALDADREARALTRQLLELDQLHTLPA